MGLDRWTGSCSFKHHPHPHHPCQFCTPGSHLSLRRWWFHSIERLSPGTEISAAVPPSPSHKHFPSFPMHGITTMINNTLKATATPCFSLSSYFCTLGFGDTSQLNYLKICICMFICSTQNDRLLVQCFNMQTTLVNQAGIERLPIICHQTVRDYYLGERLGLFSAARKLRIDWASGS